MHSIQQFCIYGDQKLSSASKNSSHHLSDSRICNHTTQSLNIVLEIAGSNVKTRFWFYRTFCTD